MLRVRFQERDSDGVWLNWDIQSHAVEYVRTGSMLGHTLGCLYLHEERHGLPTIFPMVRDVQIEGV